MKYKHNPKLTPYAKELRKNMTTEESHLWYDFLRIHPIRFLRQKIIDCYIVDFYCAKAKLAVEVDGSQHYEEDGMLNDKARTQLLESRGIKVIRISNKDVRENFQGVCDYIEINIKESLELQE